MTTLPASCSRGASTPDDEITALLMLDMGEATFHVIVGQDRVCADFNLVTLVKHAVAMQAEDMRLKAALLEVLEAAA